MSSEDQTERRKAVRAEQARRRRAAAGATPREFSRAALLRHSGVNPNTYYSRLRRKGPTQPPILSEHTALNEPSAAPVVPDTVEPIRFTAEASRLIQSVKNLPGGRDPALHASLVRLSANVSAARDVWAAADAELSALLAADDPPTYH